MRMRIGIGLWRVTAARRLRRQALPRLFVRRACLQQVRPSFSPSPGRFKGEFSSILARAPRLRTPSLPLVLSSRIPNPNPNPTPPVPEIAAFYRFLLPRHLPHAQDRL